MLLKRVVLVKEDLKVMLIMRNLILQLIWKANFIK